MAAIYVEGEGFVAHRPADDRPSDFEAVAEAFATFAELMESEAKWLIDDPLTGNPEFLHLTTADWPSFRC